MLTSPSNLSSSGDFYTLLLTVEKVRDFLHHKLSEYGAKQNNISPVSKVASSRVNKWGCYQMQWLFNSERD
jgi:hypothetical protein